MICDMCEREHDGTRMRTDPRYNRVSRMLDECPHDSRGLIMLCHVCQREVYFQHGYINWLAKITIRMARAERDRQRVARKRKAA